LTAVGTVIPSRVYPVITIRAVSSIIGFLPLFDWGTTNVAKPYRMIGFREQARKWFVPVGTASLKRGYRSHCEHDYLLEGWYHPWLNWICRGELQQR